MCILYCYTHLIRRYNLYPKKRTENGLEDTLNRTHMMTPLKYILLFSIVFYINSHMSAYGIVQIRWRYIYLYWIMRVCTYIVVREDEH